MKQDITASVYKDGTWLLEDESGELEIIPPQDQEVGEWFGIITIRRSFEFDLSLPYEIRFSDGRSGDVRFTGMNEVNESKTILSFHGIGPLRTDMKINEGIDTAVYDREKQTRSPVGFLGSQVLRIGTPVDGLLEGGGMVIDYIPPGESQARRVVFEFTELGIWISREYQLDHHSKAEVQ